MTAQLEPKGHDMSRFWRLVSVENGQVTGTWWVARPDRRGKQHITPIDVTVWNGPGREWGQGLRNTRLTVWISDGKPEIPKVGRHEPVIQDNAEAIMASALAAAQAATWPDDEADEK